MITNDQIFKAIESITGLTIVNFHTESGRYAFKSFNPHFGKYWHTLDIQFVDSIAICF